MARFLDGPAEGHELALRACPTMLRVVLTENLLGEAVTIDALDQPEDRPEPGERIEVYRTVPGTHSAAFLCGRGSKGPRGRYEFADYRHVEVAPDRLAELADREEWRRWVEARLTCTCGHRLESHPAAAGEGRPCVQRTTIGEANELTGEGYCECKRFEVDHVASFG